MKRKIDVVIAILVLLGCLPLMLVIYLSVRLSSRGSAFFWSSRVGQNNKIFKMPKYRTMLIDTPLCATHLLENPQGCITPVGRFLRKSSLDELPQLISVIRGDMSLVGPRPALIDQEDLIRARTGKRVHTLKPGITGLAQINGRDELSVDEKVNLDQQYLDQSCVALDLQIIFLTVARVFRREGISH